MGKRRQNTGESASHNEPQTRFSWPLPTAVQSLSYSLHAGLGTSPASNVVPTV